MNGYEDRVPAYLTFRIAPQEGPIAAFADQEAWQAREHYPDLLGVGMPEFFYATERDTGGWELCEYGAAEPQPARDSLGSHFRRRAKEAEDAGDAQAARTWMAAALRMDHEVIDELRVRGERFRIVRASKFIRMGRSGPEPPRPSDPDPAEVGEAYRMPSRTKGFIVDPYISAGMSESLLKLDLVQFVGVAPGAPPEVCEDAVRAVENYPGGVLLPAVFMVSERVDGRWKAQTPAASDSTPQQARDGLAAWLRVMAPFRFKLSDEKRAAYARAADVLDAKRSNTLCVDGRRFRITRVERLIRIGPDGPEGPRPSDFDSQPPVEVHAQQLKEKGLWKDENEPLELSEEALELKALWDQEEARRAAAKERREKKKPR
ncbi:PE-PGRS family protein [Streptomyces sp. NRRL F-4489]|uniref:DUF5954 family protein n=1 Tax=Streptomyces sp. NRRL F-4489 TaxID=1609095 RepID=UPI00074A483F|nr:DUF5954 family protein [Streptomyces sp. NRRL F-4489]KUL55365.1 PE-PGRS family protein [Streptomyces sp. NRRL F-4489]